MEPRLQLRRFHLERCSNSGPLNPLSYRGSFDSCETMILKSNINNLTFYFVRGEVGPVVCGCFAYRTASVKMYLEWKRGGGARSSLACWSPSITFLLYTSVLILSVCACLCVSVCCCFFCDSGSIKYSNAHLIRPKYTCSMFLLTHPCKS